jgi:hypothetical protein
MNNSIPDKLSTLFGSLPQQAVDEAIEQHRLKGHAIAQSDGHGNGEHPTFAVSKNA